MLKTKMGTDIIVNLSIFNVFFFLNPDIIQGLCLLNSASILNSCNLLFFLTGFQAQGHLKVLKTLKRNPKLAELPEKPALMYVLQDF